MVRKCLANSSHSLTEMTAPYRSINEAYTYTRTYSRYTDYKLFGRLLTAGSRKLLLQIMEIVEFVIWESWGKNKTTIHNKCGKLRRHPVRKQDCVQTKHICSQWSMFYAHHLWSTILEIIIRNSYICSCGWFHQQIVPKNTKNSMREKSQPEKFCFLPWRLSRHYSA